MSNGDCQRREADDASSLGQRGTSGPSWWARYLSKENTDKQVTGDPGVLPVRLRDEDQVISVTTQGTTPPFTKTCRQTLGVRES